MDQVFIQWPWSECGGGAPGPSPSLLLAGARTCLGRSVRVALGPQKHVNQILVGVLRRRRTQEYVRINLAEGNSGVRGLRSFYWRLVDVVTALAVAARSRETDRRVVEEWARRHGRTSAWTSASGIGRLCFLASGFPTPSLSGFFPNGEVSSAVGVSARSSRQRLCLPGPLISAQR